MTPFPDAVSTEEALACLDEVFELAPSFLSVLRGPEHVLERINRAYTALVGDRPLVGLSVREALPEVAEQGLVEVLDGVYRTGEPFVASELPVLLRRGGAEPEQRWVTLVCQPLRGPDGSITGIAAHGVDVTEHVQTRQALAVSERHFRSLIENSRDKIAVLSDDGVIQYVSPAVELLLGWQAAEMQGRRAVEFIPPEERPAALEHLRAAVAKPDETRQFEHRMRHRDGTWRLFETVGQARSLNGRVEIVTNSRDITARRQQEEALQEARQRASAELQDRESRFRALVELIPQLVWSTTADGYHDYFNQRWYDYTGVSREGQQGWNWQDFLHPEDHEHTVQAWERSLRTGEPYEVEYRFRNAADGEYRWFMGRALPLRGEDGAVVRWFGTCTDVHNERLALEAARESREGYRAITLATNDVIWDWDIASGRVKRNDNLCTMLKFRPGQLPDTSDAGLDRVHPDDRSQVSESLTLALHGGADTWSHEYRLICGDGSIAQVLDRARIVRDGAGAPVRMIGSMIDLTERNRLEQELRQSQKMEAIGKLAGGVAHDFNNLLTVITNYAELLLEEMRDEPLRKDVEGIRKAADRAASLTRQLLAFSRRQVLQLRVVDLNDIVGDMQSMLCRVIGEDIELQAELADGLKQVYADPGQLEQVILNLAVNARDAMRTGGSMLLRTDNVCVGVAEAAAQGPAPGDYVLLMVADTGQGMDEATRSRACEPFFTTKAPGEGTGLGLSTVHGIVSQLGGYIDITSQPGRGTAVRVLLPVRAVVDTPEKPKDEVAERVIRAATILLVEDEEAVRSITRRALTRNGCSVIEAGNGHEAVKMFRQHADTIDLVLTDLVMPGMGGRELAAYLHTASPDLPVLFMSGYADDGLLPDNADAGFLEKPFSLAQLLSAVAGALAARPRC